MFPASNSLVEPALEVVRTLRDAGYAALFAGGCVRDTLLGRALKDIDIATSAPPDAVEQLFPGRTVAVGKAFGVIVVRTADAAFEVATFRSDGDYRDGRRPEQVRFSDAAADAQRRDFTINGLFYDPVDGQVLDYVNGRADLDARCVRAIGNPDQRFREDHLRLLRAVRFASVLEFDLDPATEAAIARQAGLLASVSAERIGNEFTRLLTEAPRPSRGLVLLERMGLLVQFLPEVVRLQHTPQPPEFHPEGDVWTHTLLMLDALPPPRDTTLAYAILLHDIGKPDTTTITASEDGATRIRSPNHAARGAELTPELLRRLRQPESVAGDVAAMVRRHMTFSEVERMRPATLRRFMGAPTFARELQLHELDLQASSGPASTVAFLEAQRAALAAEPVLPPPWVRGADLLALGLKPGPAVGAWLNRAYDAQLEARFPDRESLLAWLRQEVALAEPLCHNPYP